MTAVHVDMLDSGLYEETPEGVLAEVDLLVTDLPGDEWQRRAEALRAVGVPRIGEVHPANSDIVALRRRVDPVTNRTNAYRVRITYGVRDENAVDRSQRYGPVTWSGSSRSFSEITREDINGRQMSVYYAGRPVIEILNLSTGVVIDGVPGVGYYRAARIAEVEVERPVLELLGTRWERDDPERTASEYQSSVNADSWRGYPPYTAIAREIAFDPDPLGGWQVRYRMDINPRTWRVQVAIQIFNQVPQDATIGNGLEVYDVLRPLAFGPLGL